MKHDIFIDESCHLEHDGFSAMCIGCIKVPENMQEKYKADMTTGLPDFYIQKQMEHNESISGIEKSNIS